MASIEAEVDAVSERAWALCQRGQYAEALQLATWARDNARAHLGERHPSHALSLTVVAAVYGELGRHTEAAELLQQVLDINRIRLDPRHPDLATDLNNLATSYTALARYVEAESLLQEGLDLLDEGHADRPVLENSRAFVYKATGNYRKAEPLYLRATEAFRSRSRVEFATGLNNLGQLYKAMGRYAEAERHLREAIEIRREVLGRRHRHYAQSVNNLANLYRMIGRHADAEPLFEQALDLRRTAFGVAHADSLQTLQDLAMLCFSRGDYPIALGHAREALEICRRHLGREDANTAEALTNMGAFHELTGDYAEAERHYREALEMHRGAGRSEQAAVALSALAGIREATGDYRVAHALHQEALQARRAAFGADHPAYAVGLHKLAELLAQVGDFDGAERLFTQALGIRRQRLGEQAEEVADTLNGLAVLRYLMRDYADAFGLVGQALDIQRAALGPDHPAYAGTLQNLAGLHAAIEEYAAAEPLLRQVLELRRRTFGPKHWALATHLNNLGSVCFQLGKFDEAEALHQEALEGQRAQLGEEHPNLAQTLNNLGLLYHAMGRHAEAERLLRKAVTIWDGAAGYGEPRRTAALINLALVLVATGRAGEALKRLSESAAIEDRLMGRVFSAGSDRQRGAYLRWIRRFFDAFLTLAIVQGPESAELAGDTLDLILRRKALLAEAWAAQRDAVLGGRHPELEPQLQELKVVRMQIAQKTLAGPGLEGVGVHRELLARWRDRLEALEAELAGEIPEVGLEQQLQAADRRAVAARLPEGAALVELVRYRAFDFSARLGTGAAQWKPARYAAAVLRASEPDGVALVDLGEAERIERLVAALRASLSGASSVPSEREPRPLATDADVGVDPGVALRQAIFDPLVPALGQARRLFVAPDGDLALVPFEVLPAAAGRRLIEDYRISYLGVGRDLLRFAVPPGAVPAPPLVAADPDFDLAVSAPIEAPTPPASITRHARGLDRGSLRFGRLVGTRREGEEVAALLGVEPVLGAEVLEAYMKAARSPLILHVATHGFFLGDPRRDAVDGGPLTELALADGEETTARLSAERLENPLLRSGLALAGANTWLSGKPLPLAAEDGIMTAEDVSGLDLLATELVVLSACETGLGHIEIGEGVFGLRRALILAGARTAIMSLWKVPDHHTQELMVEFYRRILDGRPRGDALRDAQLAMQRRYGHPYYWGAFICQGDPGPLRVDVTAGPGRA